MKLKQETFRLTGFPLARVPASSAVTRFQSHTHVAL